METSTLKCPDFNYILILTINFLYMFSVFISGTAIPQFVYNYFRALEGLSSAAQNSSLSSSSRCAIVNVMDSNSTVYADQTTIQQNTANFSLYSTIITFIPALLYSIVIGPVSDLKGRKFLLIIGIIGTFALMGMFAVVALFNLNIYILYAASFIYGTCGSFASVIQVTNAYMADLTSADNKRSVGIALLAVGTGIGTIAGTFIAGYMIEYLEYISCFICSFCLNFINLGLVICFLPETVKRQTINFRKQAKHSVKALVSFYTGSEFKGMKFKYLMLIIAFTFTFLRDMGMNGFEKLFVLNSPFCWGPIQISWFFTIKSIAFNVVGLILVKLLQYCTNDEGIACLGSLSTVGFFIIYALAETEVLLYTSIAVGVLGDMVFPMIRACLSKMTPQEKQGAVFSGTCVVETLSILCSGIMMNAIYSATVGFMKGFVFLLAAGFSLICTILLGILVLKGENKNGQKEISNIQIDSSDEISSDVPKDIKHDIKNKTVPEDTPDKIFSLDGAAIKGTGKFPADDASSGIVNMKL